MEREIPQELRRYVEEEILPQYAQSDPAHGLGHIRAVVENSLELLDLVPADPRLVYVIAAYHDLGAARFGREDHEKTSAWLLRQDRALERWFTPEERELMAQAVEDHRASGGREPRSVYGKIVSEADRDIDPERVVQRVMAYGKYRYPQLGAEGQVRRAVAHIREKYGEGGYLKLWLSSPRNQAGLYTLRKWLSTGELEEVCRKYG